MTEENKFIKELGEVLETKVLTEKLIIAPTLRIGHEWLENIAFRTSFINARIKTLPTLAIEVASPVLSSKGLSYLNSRLSELYSLSLLLNFGGEYFQRLGARPSVARAIKRTIEDLRLAEVRPEKLRNISGGMNTLICELAKILEKYEAELKERKLMDYADTLKISKKIIQESFDIEDFLIITSSDVYESFKPLERSFFDSFPKSKRVVIETDKLCDDELPTTDSRLLSWISNPIDAPQPRFDGTAKIFRALGEVNEVSQVFRIAISEGIPLDNIEILYTDKDTYIPLIYELCCFIAKKSGIEEIPATFEEGIPVWLSRPAKALSLWFDWSEQDYPQSILLKMIEEGLLSLEEGVDSTKLAKALRKLRILFGRERYSSIIEKEKSIRNKSAFEGGKSGEFEEEASLLETLERLSKSLIELAEKSREDEHALDCICEFLEKHARSASQLDEYSRGRILEVLEDASNLFKGIPFAQVDIRWFVRDLLRDLSVGGSGHREGKVHVAPLFHGGYSRPITFVVGLDDSRFALAQREDPLLDDETRKDVSHSIQTSYSKLKEVELSLERLLSRKRGRIFLGYCAAALDEDREMFPSRTLVQAYRILSGDCFGDYSSFEGWLDAPISFAPTSKDECFDDGDYWLFSLLRGRGYKGEILFDFYPNIKSGFEARLKRDSEDFTEYDGFVPEAGVLLDPFNPDGEIISSSKLETLARCPFEYFLRYVLGVEPLEDLSIDSSRWLDGRERGILLHEIFRDFLCSLKEGREQAFKAARKILHEIVLEKIKRKSEEIPPLSETVFNREQQEIKRICNIFLNDCISSKDNPLYFEVNIGSQRKGSGVCPLESSEPVFISLPHGKIRVKAQIDRIDSVGGKTEKLKIVDYKTGSPRVYEKKHGEPAAFENFFKKSRIIQPYLYFRVVNSRLEEIMPSSKVSSFVYIFYGTGEKQHGEAVEWELSELASGESILSNLCMMLSLGVFPLLIDKDNFSKSEYSLAFGDLGKTPLQVKRKIKNEKNEVLKEFKSIWNL